MSDWPLLRDYLDARSEAAFEALVGRHPADEKRLFDRAFLGVMGVVLGTGVDKSNSPPGFLGR